MNQNILALTGEIVAAHVASNTVATTDLPSLITAVYDAFERLGAPVEAVVEKPAGPAVSVKSSVKPDSIACLECGKRYKTIRRHIEGHGLSETEYRAKWKLPSDYPMTSPEYSAHRSKMAVSFGLGKKRKPIEAETAPKARKKLGVSA